MCCAAFNRIILNQTDKQTGRQSETPSSYRHMHTPCTLAIQLPDRLGTRERNKQTIRCRCYILLFLVCMYGEGSCHMFIFISIFDQNNIQWEPFWSFKFISINLPLYLYNHISIYLHIYPCIFAPAFTRKWNLILLCAKVIKVIYLDLCLPPQFCMERMNE